MRWAEATNVAAGQEQTVQWVGCVCGWAGSAADLPQHLQLSRLAEDLAAVQAEKVLLLQERDELRQEKSDLAARLAAVEGEKAQLQQEKSDLIAHLATVEEEKRRLLQENGQLLQEKHDLAESVAFNSSLSGAAHDEEDKEDKAKEDKEGKEDRNKEDGEKSAASRSSESSLGAPFDSSKHIGVSAVGRHQEVISPSLSLGPARVPLPVGLLFPDGNQVCVTMMSGVKEIPAVKDMLQKAAHILGFDLLKLCLEGPGHKLLHGANCECALYVACLAGLEKLRNEREEAVTRTQAMAGMRTGEIVALKAAGVFSFEDGLKLAKVYGEACVEAHVAGGQAALSVVGLDKPKLAELCAEAAMKEGARAVCHISHEVSQLVFVAAGTEKSILELKDLAEKAGALQARLVGHAAYHTPLMKPAEARLSAVLDELLPNMGPPRATVYMNVTGAPVRPGTKPKDIVKLLKKHLTSPVLWGASIHGMIEEGVSEFYDVGPGSQLKDGMRRQNAKIWRHAMTNIDV